MISRNDFHVIQGDRERSSVTDANTTRSTKPRVFFLARADDLTNGDDFFADSERRHVFLCFYKRFARALGYAGAHAFESRPISSHLALIPRSSRAHPTLIPP